MLKVISLQDFDYPSFENLASRGFLNNNLVSCSKQELNEEYLPISSALRDLPSINITPEILATREFSHTVASKDLFLPVENSVVKRILNTWREKGFYDALKAAASENPSEITPQAHWFLNKLLYCLDIIKKGKIYHDGLPVPAVNSIADIAIRESSDSMVRCIAWHPHCTRFAIATRDDRIRLFSNNSSPIAVLRHGAQKSVCHMQWRPHSGRELAAACQSGVLIWTVELGAASNSLSHALLLQHRNHSPVTSIAWHPEGEILVSSSIIDLNIIIWDVAREKGIPIKKIGSCGVCLICWSSCGSKLLTASCNKIFRIWNIGAGNTWESEKWNVPNGRVATACFGPNLTLLFTSSEDPAMVFSLPLQEQIFDSKSLKNMKHNKAAIPLIDLSKVVFTSDDLKEQITVGGRVLSMDWDPTGKYLAIIFQDSPLVAVFKTKIENISRIKDVKPLCFIRHFNKEIPNCIKFYQNYSDLPNIAYLTIAWSNGCIQHFPIVDSITQVHTELVDVSNTFNISDAAYTSFQSFSNYN